MRFLLQLSVALGLLTTISYSAEPAVKGFDVIDAKKLREYYKVDHIKPSRDALKRFRVVIIDTSFDGFVEGSGQLPDSARMYLSFGMFPKEFQDSLRADAEAKDMLFDPDGEAEPSTHGLEMAKIHHAVMGQYPEGPEYSLVVARNPYCVQRAFRYADWINANEVIIAQNMPGIGNRDGIGPEYKEIQRYHRRANAFTFGSAGNYGRMTHTTLAKTDKEDRFIFKDGQKLLRLKVRVDGKIKITAVVDAFTPQGTDRDFDLYVLGEDGHTLYEWESYTQIPGDKTVMTKNYAAAEHKQIFRQGEEDDEDPVTTTLPVEELVIPFKKNTENGYYYIELRDRSHNFRSRDEISVVVRPVSISAGSNETIRTGRPSVELLDWTEGRNVYYPNDDADTFTVSETTYAGSRGPTANGIIKPEIFMAATDVIFSNGRMQSGTSPATAVMSGIAGLFMTQYPDINRDRLRQYLKSLSSPNLAQSLEEIRSLWKRSDYYVNEELKKFYNGFPNLYSLLRDYNNGNQVEMLGVRNENYVLAYTVHPSTFSEMFKHYNIPADAGYQYEYYVAVVQKDGVNQLWPYARKRRSDASGEEQPLPWYQDYAPYKEAKYYVELRKARSKEERDALTTYAKENYGKTWRNPTDEEGKRYFER